MREGLNSVGIGRKMTKPRMGNDRGRQWKLFVADDCFRERLEIASGNAWKRLVEPGCLDGLGMRRIVAY